MFETTIQLRWHVRGRAKSSSLAAAAPVILLPAIAVALIPWLTDWQAMLMVALSIYAGLKWQTLVSCPTAQCSSTTRWLGYLLLWPGMDAGAFFDAGAIVAAPKRTEWLLAILNSALGLIFVCVIVPQVVRRDALLAAWIGLAGLVLMVHFGLFHISSLAWRRGGVNATPIMNSPILSASLGDFWGRRWNRAFRDVALRQLCRPLSGQIGVAWATMTVFVVSGLVHELVISVPVRAGWGGPASYFVLQGIGLLVERSRVGHWLGFGRGAGGRLICGLFVVAPLGLLFHEPFMRHAILPLLAAIRAI